MIACFLLQIGNHFPSCCCPTSMRPTLKNLVFCAPTYPSKLALPQKIYGHFGKMIFFFFKLKTMIQFQRSVLIKASYNISTMKSLFKYIYFFNHIHVLIKVSFFFFSRLPPPPPPKKKKNKKIKNIFLPILKSISRGTANKVSFKDGLNCSD